MNQRSYLFVDAAVGRLFASPLPFFVVPTLRAPIGTLNPRTWRRRFGARNARGPKPQWKVRS